jgi:hypothetical protein
MDVNPPVFYTTREKPYIMYFTKYSYTRYLMDPDVTRGLGSGGQVGHTWRRLYIEIMVHSRPAVSNTLCICPREDRFCSQCYCVRKLLSSASLALRKMAE